MAQRIFLKIGDIKGESTDKNHKDEIDVQSWTWGLTQQVIHAIGGETALGRAKFDELQFTHKVDLASTALMLACAGGRHLKDARLTARKGGNKPLEYLVITLKDVLITSVRDAGDAAATGTHETATLIFSSIDVMYTPQTASGAGGTPVHFKWDVQANKPG